MLRRNVNILQGNLQLIEGVKSVIITGIQGYYSSN